MRLDELGIGQRAVVLDEHAGKWRGCVVRRTGADAPWIGIRRWFRRGKLHRSTEVRPLNVSQYQHGGVGSANIQSGGDIRITGAGR